MATIDLSNANVPIDMTDPNLVGFDTVDNATPDVWSFLTPTGHDLQLEGQGMTFDAQGRALSGTVQSIAIDLGNDDFANPDLVITGINVQAATLDDDAQSFWRFLEGNDTIIGPSYGPTSSLIFGDGLVARAGASTGGNDMFELADCQVVVAGDVWTVGSQTTGSPIARYRGGSDTITGGPTAQVQALAGDAFYVYATGDLKGGDDNILCQSTTVGSFAVGDAGIVVGTVGGLATVIGGNDVIAGGSLSEASLVGDVYLQIANSFVRGGNDIIKGSDAREKIIGDVYQVRDNQMIGGADKLWAGGGDDVVYGDFFDVGAGGMVTAGDDTIHGEDGSDFIFGDGSDPTKTTGGDDRLFGEAGDDNVVGGTGNDLLDGGAGADNLLGGAGNDTYVIDSALDFVSEQADQGVDLVRSYLADVTLMDNVENLTFIGNGDFEAVGNALANTIRGGAGADYMDGRAGNDRLFGGAGVDFLFGDYGDDVLNGGAGADTLVGADGFDLASYAGSEQAVKVALAGAFAATGDAVGDTFTSIEGLKGSDFGDVLRGDGDANELYGEAGNDRLVGAAGRDVLTGGTGADIFDFNAISETGATGATRDRIADFTQGSDKIDLATIDADIVSAGNQAFAFIGAAAFSGAAGELRAVTSANTTIIMGDVNGDGAADFHIQLNTPWNMTAGDFAL